jgi:acyl-coenzyme A synthetase/AMP-(fatty) acid ligase
MPVSAHVAGICPGAGCLTYHVNATIAPHISPCPLEYVLALPRPSAAKLERFELRRQPVAAARVLVLRFRA